MKWKKTGALAFCLALAFSLLVMSASAETAPGVYTAGMVTTYYNPDTGIVDDGGTANAALGEGMCRSATDKTALVEVDGNGEIWLTVRLLLQSNCSNVAFYTRNGYDSYSQVSYDVIAEDAANDSIDYRFKVTEAGQKIKCTMYVAPMGRDVLWYLYVDTGTLASGSGDFVVSIDTANLNAEPAAPVEPVPAPAEAVPNEPVPELQSAAAETESPEMQEQREEPEKHPEEIPAGPDAPEDAAVQEDITQDETTAPEEIQKPEEDSSAASDESESAVPGEIAPGDSESPEETGRLSGGSMAGGAAAVLLVLGAAVYFVKRKKPE